MSCILVYDDKDLGDATFYKCLLSWKTYSLPVAEPGFSRRGNPESGDTNLYIKI